MSLEPTQLTIYPNDFLYYFDETGEETLSDDGNPFFAIGGCAISGQDYMSEIDAPWRELKERYFEGGDAPLHAAKLDLNNKAGIGAVGEFFRTRRFFRFGTAVTRDTKLETAGTTAYENLAHVVIEQTSRFIVGVPISRVVLVFESSDRGNELAMRHFSDFKTKYSTPEGPAYAPMERHFMPKHLNHPALEVADFIVQALGGHVRSTIIGGRPVRADVKAVFGPPNEGLSDLRVLSWIRLKYPDERDA